MRIRKIHQAVIGPAVNLKRAIFSQKKRTYAAVVSRERLIYTLSAFHPQEYSLHHNPVRSARG
jgi:hypothetical protein